MQNGVKTEMNEAPTIPKGFGVASIGEQFAFLRLPSTRGAKEISPSIQQIFENIAEVHDQMIAGVIEKRTVSEFRAARDAVFSNYAHIMRAISDLARVVIPPRVLERQADESFCELESDFREHGDSLGSAVRDQVIFTIWTFRKIKSLVQQIASKDAPDGAQEQERDRELSSSFAFYALWTRFHLDCLTLSMHCHKPIYPEARDEIADGLRAAVNAYASVKQGLELRNPVMEPVLARPEWDDEDQELLDSSIADLGSEFLQ